MPYASVGGPTPTQVCVVLIEITGLLREKKKRGHEVEMDLDSEVGPGELRGRLWKD